MSQPLQPAPATTVVLKSDEQLTHLVNATFALNLDSSTAQIVNDLLNDHASNIDEIARAIALDPTVATRIIRIVNSAFFGIAEHITDLSRAIQLIGFDNIKEIVNSMSLLRIFSVRKMGNAALNNHMDGLWRHSIATGVAAQVLSKRFPEVPEIHALTAGLLHDVGKAAMLIELDAKYQEVVDVAIAERVPIAAIERRFFDFDHAMLGRAICEAWGQLDDVSLAVGRHHSVRSGYVYDACSSLTALVHVADILAHALGVGWWGDRVMPKMDVAARVSLDLLPDDAQTLLDELEEEYPVVLARMNQYFPVILQR